MTDAHVVWRAPIICAIVFIAASTLPVAAQPRDLARVDQAVTQQQASLDQLRASVEQLKKDNDALRQTLNDINRKTAPPEAWKALGGVGFISVVAWTVVTLFREWTSKKLAEAEMSLKSKTGTETHG
jgi:uncharacterized coiled-coil protein SlyX